MAEYWNAREAWRRGELDADRCGLSAIDEHGAHWIAGNLRLDLAAKVEMLPWDVWGAGWEPGGQPGSAHLQLFDAGATAVSGSCASATRPTTLRMNGTVFNVLRGSAELV